MVRVVCHLGAGNHVAIGYAKWNPADAGVEGLDWSETRGLEIAKGRAISQLARKLLASGELELSVPYLTPLRWHGIKLADQAVDGMLTARERLSRG